MTSALQQESCLSAYEAVLPLSAVDIARLYVVEHGGLVGDFKPEGSEIFADTIANAWDRITDSALWGLLGHLIEANPHWPDSQCRNIVEAWIEVRSSHRWYRKLNKFWPRWEYHHQQLQEGLARAGHLTWRQKCCFCELWSASRPMMAPFCGVAEILLTVNDSIAKPLNSLRQKTFARQKGEKQPISELIVISVDNEVDAFIEFGASRQLHWALNNSGMSWSLHQPWDFDLNLDPAIVKGVVFWSMGHRNHDFVYHALAIEETCKKHNIPVINSISAGWDVRHSAILNNFKRAGIRCPSFQRFTDVDDIRLPYPFILRVDGIHRGQTMQLVHDEEEARSLVSIRRGEFLTGESDSLFPPPNLAVEFINVANERGLFHKCRAYVVGSKVILRHKTISTSWLVNHASSESFEDSSDANRKFIRGAGIDLALLARAGRASGSDVTALDFSIDSNGEYVFWEANRLFNMNGDKDYDLAESPTCSEDQRRIERDRKLGESLLSLLQERIVQS
jgi:hypothetical protein